MRNDRRREIRCETPKAMGVLAASPALPNWAKAALLTWFVASFFQYPGIQVGNITALLPGHLFFPLVLPALALSRGVLARFGRYFMVVNAAFLASFITHLDAQGFSSGIALNGILYFNSFFVQILGGMLLAACRPMEIGIALLIGIGGNALVGALQFWSFGKGVFCLAFLYNHLAFREFDTFTQMVFVNAGRPFGLYPEPSLMGACLGPWMGYLFGGCLVGSPWSSSRNLKVLSWLTFVLGAALLLLSRTGNVVILVVALGVFSLRHARLKTLAAIAIAVVLIGGLLQATGIWSSLKGEWRSKIEQADGNDSWSVRVDSLGYALKKEADADFYDHCFGFGPFNSSAQIHAETVFSAIWSASASFLYENGLVGLVAVASLLVVCVRRITKSSLQSVGVLVLALWVVFFTIGTSYYSALPLWSAFGLLLSWDTYCRPSAPGGNRVAALAARTRIRRITRRLYAAPQNS